MKARNFNVFNKPRSHKHAPRFKYRTWNIKHCKLGRAGSQSRVLSSSGLFLFQWTSILVKYSQTIYPLFPKTWNWGMWKILWMLHSSSGPYGHTQLLTAALPAGIWSIIVTGGKPDLFLWECCQKGEGRCLCSLREEMEASIWSKSTPEQQPLGNCTNKFPEKPFICWPNPAWQCPHSLQWDWTRWPVKVHATPKHSNIAHFPVKLLRAADQQSLPAFPSYWYLLWDGLKGTR